MVMMLVFTAEFRANIKNFLISELQSTLTDSRNIIRNNNILIEAINLLKYIIALTH